MADPMTPDPREEKQPGWVQQTLAALRGKVRDAEQIANATKGQHPGTNVRLLDKTSTTKIDLPKNSQVEFDSNWGRIIVGHELDGKVRVQGDSAVTLHPSAANSFSVELKD